jgi:hypothetical protein
LQRPRVSWVRYSEKKKKKKKNVTAPCLIRYLSVSEILTPWRPDPKCITLSSCEPLRASLIGE